MDILLIKIILLYLLLWGLFFCIFGYTTLFYGGRLVNVIVSGLCASFVLSLIINVYNKTEISKTKRYVITNVGVLVENYHCDVFMHLVNVSSPYQIKD